MFPCEMARYIAGFPGEARKYRLLGRPEARNAGVNPANSGLKSGFPGYDTPRSPSASARPSPLYHFHPAVLEPVDPADHLELILFHRSIQNRGRRAELADIIDHILLDRVGERITGLL